MADPERPLSPVLVNRYDPVDVAHVVLDRAVKVPGLGRASVPVDDRELPLLLCVHVSTQDLVVGDAGVARVVPSQPHVGTRHLADQRYALLEPHNGQEQDRHDQGGQRDG